MYYLSEYDWIVEGLEISDNDLRYSIEQLGLKTHHGWIFDHDLKYQNYDPIRYVQHTSKSFIPNLSIIDLLFNEGTDGTQEILKNSTVSYS